MCVQACMHTHPKRVRKPTHMHTECQIKHVKVSTLQHSLNDAGFQLRSWPHEHSGSSSFHAQIGFQLRSWPHEHSGSSSAHAQIGRDLLCSLTNSTQLIKPCAAAACKGRKQTRKGSVHEHHTLRASPTSQNTWTLLFLSYLALPSCACVCRQWGHKTAVCWTSQSHTPSSMLLHSNRPRHRLSRARSSCCFCCPLTAVVSAAHIIHGQSSCTVARMLLSGPSVCQYTRRPTCSSCGNQRSTQGGPRVPPAAIKGNQCSPHSCNQCHAISTRGGPRVPPAAIKGAAAAEAHCFDEERTIPTGKVRLPGAASHSISKKGGSSYAVDHQATMNLSWAWRPSPLSGAGKRLQVLGASYLSIMLHAGSRRAHCSSKDSTRTASCWASKASTADRAAAAASLPTLTVQQHSSFTAPFCWLLTCIEPSTRLLTTVSGSMNTF